MYNLQASKWLIIIYFAATFLSCYGIYGILNLSVYAILLIIIITLIGCYNLKRFALLQHHKSIVAVSLHKKYGLILICKNKLKFSGFIVKNSSFISPIVMVLHVVNKHIAHKVVIFKDQLSDPQFRELSAKLKI